MTDALTRWCPPPDGTVPWDALDAELSWVRAMGLPADPIHHAEGNVWIHTRMVLEALVALPRWRALPTRERELVFAACLLHDIAAVDHPGARRRTRHRPRPLGCGRHRRPACALGARRRSADREAICGSCGCTSCRSSAWRTPPGRRAVMASLRARCDHLALVNEADGRGRVRRPSANRRQRRPVRGVVRGGGCWTGPFDFASPSARCALRARGPAASSSRLPITAARWW